MQIGITWIDILVVSPLLALFIASLCPLAVKVIGGNKEPNRFVPFAFGLLGVISAAGLAIGNWGIQSLAFGGAIIFDGVAAVGALIILAITGFSLVFLKENNSITRHQFSEAVFLVLNSTIGMILFCWSNDLIVTFIGIELMSLCLYVLIALSEEEHVSKEASFKYFILGSFATAVLLYGISFIYGSAGTTSLSDLTETGAALISSSRMFLIGFVMLMTGLLFKISVFPFHAWSPDVYQGSPTPVTTYMAAGVKAATILFLLRVMSLDTLLSERAFPLLDIIQWLAVFTILFGNIGALRQTSLKRMLAYSSVGHAGYLLIGLVTAGIGGQDLIGATGVMFYVFAYTIMTLGTFGFVSMLEREADHEIFMEDIKGLGNRKPILAAAMTIMLLSLAGIPPTVGFFGKFFILGAAIKQNLNWLAFWGVLGAAISVYFYLRPIVAMYMEKLVISEKPAPRGQGMSHFVVCLMALLTIGFGIMAEPIFQSFFKTILEIFG